MSKKINHKSTSIGGSKLNSVKTRVGSFVKKFKKQTLPNTKSFIRRRPMAAFLISLALLLLVIVGNTLLTPKPKAETSEAQPKAVEVYKIGKAPQVNVSAKIDKEGVIQIVAQMPGIVSSINFFEGQEVARGTNLVSLASNYQGGNVQSVSRQIAALQYQNTKDTYGAQKGIIQKQKDIADQSKTNADKLRDITDQSRAQTQGLLDTNISILTSLNANLAILQSTNTNGVNDQAILALQGQISQVQSGIAQLDSAQRAANYQSDPANPPTQLAQLGHDLTVQQLEIQQKALDMSQEMSRLQLVLAQISEAAMYPAAPFDGVVEKVHVVVGQSVSPGTPLVTISSTKHEATITATVPQTIARDVSKLEESVLIIGKKRYSIFPEYTTTEATDGQLFSVIYSLPEEAYDKVTDNQFVSINIPIGYADTIASVPRIPIDVVFQTQDGAVIYIAKNGVVKAKKIELGEVLGNYVTVDAGLASGDQVILDRSVIAGEKVKVTN